MSDAGPKPESPIEVLKRNSRYLRGTLETELSSTDPSLSADSQQLIKLHGLYQQKDRDKPKVPEVSPVKLPTLMARGRVPGGRLSAASYLAWDAIADQFGDRSLRLTTRQSLELHGILKGDVKAALKKLACRSPTLTSCMPCAATSTWSGKSCSDRKLRRSDIRHHWSLLPSTLLRMAVRATVSSAPSRTPC